MIRRFFSAKLLAFFAGMAIIGFFIGYDYALITTRYSNSDVLNTSDRIQKEKLNHETDKHQNDDTVDDDQNAGLQDFN